MSTIQSTIASAVDRMEKRSRVTRVAVYLGVLAFLYLLVPTVIFGESGLTLLTRGLIFGLFAMGYDFMYGYSGMVSFGHAALFGAGAYGLAVAFSYLGIQSIWLILLLGILGGIIYSLIVGVISIRTREVYFAILTLAFAEVFRVLIIQYDNITGGFNGVVLLLPEWSIVPGFLQVSVYETLPFYYIVVTFVVITFVILRRITQSPMGSVFRGIRENINRLQYIGIDERRYRIVAFVISGAVSGLAGALYAIELGFIGPNILTPVQSGQVIIWTIIGGQGTLVGPLFGGTLIFYVSDTISSSITWYLIPLGTFFIVMMIFAPDGIAGWAKSLAKYVRNWGRETEEPSDTGERP